MTTRDFTEVRDADELRVKARRFEEDFDALLDEYQIEVMPPHLAFNDETERMEINPYAMHVNSMDECPVNVRGDIPMQVIKELLRRANNMTELAKVMREKLKEENE